ncbi:MAG TPA: aminotransferase class V-fold PLP-dependent enzyme, partial [Polyangiaceae bacterium]|nr:aminotransferase class V-fold PLP-dependent enzyme [Polyangiaceae bacterium]
MSEASLDFATLRADFPALDQRVHGHPLIYLDNAATTQKPRVVLEETLRCYTEYCGNVQRSAHHLAERASLEFEAARVAVQRLIGAATPEEIIFVSGATAAINVVAHGWGDDAVGPGDEVVVTQLEHHSNLLP